MHQTKLSLQLRKRNLERSESVVPPSKRQIKDDGHGPISAFGAPHLEERKITKRTINVKPTAMIEQPKEKRDIKQTTLTQHANPVPTQTTDSGVEIGLTTLESTTASDTVTLKQQQGPRAKDSSAYPIKTVRIERPENESNIDDFASATELESSPVSNLPSSSPALSTKSPTETMISPSNEKQLTTANDTIPRSSPLATPISTRQAPVETTSPSTTAHENSPSTPMPNQHASLGKSSSSVVYDKSSSSKFDKGRIHEERSILDKLVSALDITLTFHAARNVAAFFHKIQPMLRSSTCKNVTLSHLCKILFVAPELYDVETKLLREYGKDTEAHQVSIGSTWVVPMSGKVIQERKDLMTKRSGDYFEKHNEATSTIPEKELPRMDSVVDKKKWLQTASLPDNVRSILELQAKRKADKEAKASQPRFEPKGTAKDRAKALLDRIRNKQKK